MTSILSFELKQFYAGIEFYLNLTEKKEENNENMNLISNLKKQPT